MSVCFVLAALYASAHLTAQTSPTGTAKTTAQVQADLKLFTDAQKLRDDSATAISNGAETPDSIMARLQASDSPTGLKIDHDADFAFAAIGIGQRLIAARHPAEAEKLFLEAEKRLVLAVQNTPDKTPQIKAQFLTKLSFIRGNYLGNAVQAKADIEQAIALQPDDKDLQQMKATLLSGNAELFKNQPQG